MISNIKNMDVNRLRQNSLFMVIIGLIIVIALPHVIGGRIIIHTYLTSMVFIVLCCGLRLILLTGRFSIAQATLMGVGAYAAGLINLEWDASPWLGLLVGGLAAAIVAVGFGFLALRLTGVYFVIVTLAMAEVILRIIYWQRDYTGGDVGRVGLEHFDFPGYGDFGMDIMPHYYLLLAITLVTLFVFYRMERSRVGLALIACGQNNTLAQHVGVNVTRYRVLAWAIASFFAGVVGAFWVHYLVFLAPGDYVVHQSFYIMLYVFLGGMMSFWGPVVGAIAMVFILDRITFLMDYQELATGLIMIAIVLALPGGMISLPRVIITGIKRVLNKVSSKEMEPAVG